MRVFDQPAIVLHASRWRESSLLVEIFTHEHGRVGMVARGVQGPKRQSMRAALQPMQRIRVDYTQRGELAQLIRAEASGSTPIPGGEALLAGFYLCELVLRLMPRQDAHPDLFLQLAQTLGELAGSVSLAWTLRRFECDLLAAVGYALDTVSDSEGSLLDPAALYRMDPEQGAWRVRESAAPDAGYISGAALLALSGSGAPSSALLREQRLALRALIAHHLGARGLRSWNLLAEFASLRREHERTGLEGSQVQVRD